MKLGEALKLGQHVGTPWGRGWIVAFKGWTHGTRHETRVVVRVIAEDGEHDVEVQRREVEPR